MRQFQAGAPGTYHDVFSVAISPDGRSLVVAVSHEGIFLWNLAGESSPTSLRVKNNIFNHDFLFAADGRISWVNSDNRYAFDPASGKVRVAPMPTGGDVNTQIELSGNRVLTGHSTRMGVGLWQEGRKNTWDNVWFFDFIGAFHGVATGFHADRFYLHHGRGPHDPDALLTVRNFDDCEVMAEIPFCPQGVSRFKAAPDGSFVIGLLDTTLLVWRPGEKVAKVRPCGRKPMRDFAFHPTGKYVAVVGNDEAVRLLDVLTWKPVKQYMWKIGWLRAVAFSADGTLAAAGSENGQVVVWDVDV
jgi:WD40 repeat protein